MKKFLIVFGVILTVLAANPGMAEETQPLTASIEFNWTNMSQIQRDKAIQEYKDKILTSTDIEEIAQKGFKKTYKDIKKDADYRTHYRLMSNGVSETKEYDMSASFIHDDILYMYALRQKENPKKVYYYNALGHLAYLEVISDNYPNYPYFSKQYRANGKLASMIYFVDKDLQYAFEPNGDFKGVWYKADLYDKKGKKILTRNNWN